MCVDNAVQMAKPKAQAINTGPGAAESIPNKGKGKSKGKGKTKGPLCLMEKEKEEKEKERVSPNPNLSPPRMHQRERVQARVQHLEVNHPKVNLRGFKEETGAVCVLSFGLRRGSPSWA